MTEIQAALGIRQLQNLKKNVKMRNVFCKKIIKLNNNYDFLKKIEVPDYIYHSFYRFYLFVNLDKIRKKIKLEAIIKLLNNNDILCNVGSCPEIYLEKSFKVLGGYKKRLKNAKKISKNSIALCINHRFSYPDQEQYLISLKKIFEYISNKI
jgi:dTDP-4-amino-4,6-dideoxygalactose transaminase